MADDKEIRDTSAEELDDVPCTVCSSCQPVVPYATIGTKMSRFFLDKCNAGKSKNRCVFPRICAKSEEHPFDQETTQHLVLPIYRYIFFSRSN